MKVASSCSFIAIRSSPRFLHGTRTDATLVEPMRILTGKVAVVTGAASGLGRAFAQRLAEEGMKVVLADIDEARLAAVVDELQKGGHEVIGVPTDVARLAPIE